MIARTCNFCLSLDGISEGKPIGRNAETEAAIDFALAGEVEIGSKRRQCADDRRRRIRLEGVENGGLRE